MIKWLCILLFLFACPVLAQQNMADPTRPHETKKSSVMKTDEQNPSGDGQLKVTAIFVSEQGQHAIINGKNYSAGQTVLGNKVVSIEQHRVVLSGADGRKEFFINNNNAKKDTANGF
jgi:hypothetical protein